MSEYHVLNFIKVNRGKTDDSLDEMMSMLVFPECEEDVEEIGWRGGCHLHRELM